MVLGYLTQADLLVPQCSDGAVVDNAARVFAEPDDPQRREQQALVDDLYRQIGQLQMELEWLKKKVARFES